MAGAGPNRRGKPRPSQARSGDGANGSASRAKPRAGGAAAGAYRVTIPSDFEAGREVQERIMGDVERHGYSSDSTFAIRISLEEALVNAIKHGNGLDPGKKVRVEAKVTPKRAEISIEDEGPGFHRSNVPDPTADENLHKCSGRGILLIESYMNQVRWSHGGRRLTMVKENEPS